MPGLSQKLVARETRQQRTVIWKPVSAGGRREARSICEPVYGCNDADQLERCPGNVVERVIMDSANANPIEIGDGRWEYWRRFARDILARIRYDDQMAKILIVDDNPDASETLALFFRNAGHEVTCVPNGREALFTVLAQTPDVILLDLMLPVMDGPSFLEVIRSYLRISSLPVVVLTGLADSPMVDRVQSLKVNAVLTKTKATPEEVLKALEEAIVRLPG
jgi:CheY-like chemotaxis protein